MASLGSQARPDRPSLKRYGSTLRPDNAGPRASEVMRQSSVQSTRSVSFSIAPLNNRAAGEEVVPRLSTGAFRPGTPRAPPGASRSAGNLQTPARSTAISGKSDASVQVAVRIRPKLNHEALEPDCVEAKQDGRSVEVILGEGKGRKRYTVDQVFDGRQQDNNSQATVFDEFGRELVASSLGGYNICIFAYGHTGSGKTYTMLGNNSGAVPNMRGGHAGFLPRFMQEIFDACASDPQGREYQCSCEYFEIYNDRIRDLSCPAGTKQRSARVHVHPKFGMRIEGICSSVVTSVDEVLQLVAFGNQMRAVAATTMNERSSRSHAFVTLKYEQLGGTARNSDKSGQQPLIAAASVRSATFVDLAGREDRNVSGNQVALFRETRYINTSLYHLSTLISKIAEGQISSKSFADFRNSKLTMVLSQALNGNSKTALIATVAPLRCFVDDITSTLRLATSVKKIATRPVVNKSGKAMISDLEAEVRKLNRELADQRTRNHDKESQLATAQAMISSLKRSWEEAVAETQTNNHRRRQSMSSMGLMGLDSEDSGPPCMPSGLMMPFLTKLCDDPALQGCCNYFLNKPALKIGSNAESCDVVLKGLGITPIVCEIKRADDQVEVCLLGGSSNDISKARVIVGGVPLTESIPNRTLEHGESLMLGYAHAFRLVVPTPQVQALLDDKNAASLAKASVLDLDVASALAEVDPTTVGHDALSFLSQVASHFPEEAQQTLLRAIGIVGPLVEEANLITQEVSRGSNIHFELHAITDVHGTRAMQPGLVVCALERTPPLKKFQRGVAAVQRLLIQKKRVQNGAAAMDPADVFVRKPRRSIIDLVGSDDASMFRARSPQAYSIGLDAEAVIMRGCDTLLTHVLPIEEFLERLSEFREVYADNFAWGDGSDSRSGRSRSSTKGSDDSAQPRSAICLFLNPWEQSSFAESKALREVEPEGKLQKANLDRFFKDSSEELLDAPLSQQQPQQPPQRLRQRPQELLEPQQLELTLEPEQELPSERMLEAEAPTEPVARSADPEPKAEDTPQEQPLADAAAAAGTVAAAAEALTVFDVGDGLRGRTLTFGTPIEDPTPAERDARLAGGRFMLHQAAALPSNAMLAREHTLPLQLAEEKLREPIDATVTAEDEVSTEEISNFQAKAVPSVPAVPPLQELRASMDELQAEVDSAGLTLQRCIVGAAAFCEAHAPASCDGLLAQFEAEAVMMQGKLQAQANSLATLVQKLCPPCSTRTAKAETLPPQRSLEETPPSLEPLAACEAGLQELSSVLHAHLAAVSGLVTTRKLDADLPVPATLQLSGCDSSRPQQGHVVTSDLTKAGTLLATSLTQHANQLQAAAPSTAEPTAEASRLEARVRLETTGRLLHRLTAAAGEADALVVKLLMHLAAPFARLPLQETNVTAIPGGCKTSLQVPAAVPRNAPTVQVWLPEEPHPVTKLEATSSLPSLSTAVVPQRQKAGASPVRHRIIGPPPLASHVAGAIPAEPIAIRPTLPSFTPRRSSGGRRQATTTTTTITTRTVVTPSSTPATPPPPPLVTEAAARVIRGRSSSPIRNRCLAAPQPTSCASTVLRSHSAHVGPANIVTPPRSRWMHWPSLGALPPATVLPASVSPAMASSGLQVSGGVQIFPPATTQTASSILGGSMRILSPARTQPSSPCLGGSMRVAPALPTQALQRHAQQPLLVQRRSVSCGPVPQQLVRNISSPRLLGGPQQLLHPTPSLTESVPARIGSPSRETLQAGTKQQQQILVPAQSMAREPLPRPQVSQQMPQEPVALQPAPVALAGGKPYPLDVLSRFQRVIGR